MTLSNKIFFYLPLFLLIAYIIFNMKGCHKPDNSNALVNQQIEDLNFANQCLLDENFAIRADLATSDSIRVNQKARVIKGRETIKILEKTVTITDTIIITYVDALNNQIKALDSLVAQDSVTIDKQVQLIANLDTITSNQNKQIEIVQNDNKKQNRKIKMLKFERVIYPILGVAATILIMK